jgi:hypothetical protein
MQLGNLFVLLNPSLPALLAPDLLLSWQWFGFRTDSPVVFTAGDVWPNVSCALQPSNTRSTASERFTTR